MRENPVEIANLLWQVRGCTNLLHKPPNRIVVAISFMHYIVGLTFMCRSHAIKYMNICPGLEKHSLFHLMHPMSEQM